VNRNPLAVLAAITGGLVIGTSVGTSVFPGSPPAAALTLVEGAPTTPACARDGVEVIGHRGTGPGTRTLFGAARSEDTIGAFTAAMRAGADGFETDFWPTVDGQVVSHHDATLTRMTDGTGAISSWTAADVERLRNQNHARVPTFREILRAMVPSHPDVRLQQEFKDGRLFSDELVLELARLDRELVADVEAQVLVTASQLGTLERFHQLAPDLPLGLIERSPGRPPLSTVPAWVDVILIELGAADPTYIRQAAARGHEVSLRKVDSVAQLHEAVQMGATRIVTDRPEVVGESC
jgi:glycerophosphoryl diester phosphodiesterase